MIHKFKMLTPEPDRKEEDCPKRQQLSWDTNLPKWLKCYEKESFERCGSGSCTASDLLNMDSFQMAKTICKDVVLGATDIHILMAQYTCVSCEY
jgi:hypothetical protein